MQADDDKVNVTAKITRTGESLNSTVNCDLSNMNDEEAREEFMQILDTLIIETEDNKKVLK